MKKIITLISMLIMFIASVCFAEEINFNDVSENLGFSEKEELTVNGVKIEVYAHESVDLYELFSDLEETDTAEIIESKIDKRRQDLYPDEEIMLKITPEKKEVLKDKSMSQNTLGSREYPIRIKEKEKVWNGNAGWCAFNHSNAAVFILNVKSGSMKVYASEYWDWSQERPCGNTSPRYQGTFYSGDTVSILCQGFYRHIELFATGSGIADYIWYFLEK